jgi:hypothetical protein
MPAPAARHQIYYDTGVPAFGLCVTSKGARSFVIRYRRKGDGVERRMVIVDRRSSAHRGQAHPSRR